MYWSEIITILSSNKALFFNNELVNAGLEETSKPEDIANCCGLTFGQHVTWRGLWISCNPTRKAAWTRKKNREAKLRKTHATIARAGGIESFPVRPLTTEKEKALAGSLATCGFCGRSWDDSISTGWTPAPSGRCPFEPFHG